MLINGKLFRLSNGVKAFNIDLGGDSLPTRYRMLINELSPVWPPSVSDTNNTKADLGDVVVSVQNKGRGKIVVRLRKQGKYAAEYGITLTIPENVFQKTLFAIMRKTGMTLREVGELTIQ